SWSPTTNLTSSTASNPTASPTSTTTYTVTETNSNGCIASHSVVVTVNPLPAATAGSNTAICTGLSTTIGAASVVGHTYSWSPTTNLSSSTVSNPTANPTSSTTYTLTESITATGCNKSNSVTVTVNPLPAASAGSNTAICTGLSTTIGAASVVGSTYAWSPTTNLSSSTVSNPTASPTSTTTYTVTETNNNGCIASHSVVVTVNPLPAASAGANTAICTGFSTTIGAASVVGSTYSWSPTTNLSSSTVSNPTASP